jgi:hypothetical protein
MKMEIMMASKQAKKKERAKVREHLDDLSLSSDKMIIDEVRDINILTIDKRIKSVNKKTQSFFKDVFDYVTMEEEYSLKMILESARDLEFDVFDLEAKSEGNELFVYGMHIMQKEGYMYEFQMSQKKLKNFMYTLQCSYNDITYHNKTHATDVSQG